MASRQVRPNADYQDAAIDLLRRSMARGKGRQVLLLPAEGDAADDYRFAGGQARVITQRYDLAASCTAQGLPVHFEDYTFAALAPARLDLVLLRLPKAKVLLHHLVNQAWIHLRPGGTLHLAGWRRDGARSAIERVAELFGEPLHHVTTKAGARCAVFARPESETEPAWLPDSDYHRLREIATLEGTPVWSKPGCFGWQQVDPGSQRLAEVLPDLAGAVALDLGCGYGYLSLKAHHAGAGSVRAIDVNAAALRAAAANFEAHGVAGRVQPGDAGERLQGPFDAILCNPPLHRGRARDRETSGRFAQAIGRLLAPGGAAYVVVPVAIPFARLAADTFPTAEVCAQDREFKVLRLSR